MFYNLSKICWFLLQPSSVIALALIGGLVLMATRYARSGRRLVWLGTITYLVLGLSPVGGALILPLEQRFPRPDLSMPGRPVNGIIILGGAEDSRVGPKREVISLNEAGERFVEGLVLAQQFPVAKVVFTGGASDVLASGAKESETASIFFAATGLAPGRLVREFKSRNTYENAVFTREMVQPRVGERWLLVTSAFHMPRAIGCFRKAGFDVEAFPVDYRTGGTGELLRPFSSIPEGLRRIDFVVREYAGLLAYYLTGRTSALFPGPQDA